MQTTVGRRRQRNETAKTHALIETPVVFSSTSLLKANQNTERQDTSTRHTTVASRSRHGRVATNSWRCHELNAQGCQLTSLSTNSYAHGGTRRRLVHSGTHLNLEGDEQSTTEKSKYDGHHQLHNNATAMSQASLANPRTTGTSSLVKSARWWRSVDRRQNTCPRSSPPSKTHPGAVTTNGTVHTRRRRPPRRAAHAASFHDGLRSAERR